ncbi:serine/threonine-protein kinase [Streptomyces sp. NPDC005648]|uniref:serine/threonine-protein kinase n=1 Tax=Streptomyces sp. NPDC005648 TaxID=3157044 RepID=UPI0033BAC6BD
MSAGGEHTRVGRLLGGRYRLSERVGSGGMGTVWQAHDELVDRDVAVKEPRLPGDPEDEHRQRAAHRLYREARAAARVDHPAAVSIHDVVVEEDGLPWIVMELIRGESLHEVLRRGPLPAREAARIGHAVLGALRAAHAVGIVHRDVKPANVLLGAHDRVVLTDFGIAHVQGEESLTMSGEFVGSLEFVAPERMSGRGAGPSSDLWSLGVLLYAAVEGASPFRRTTLESTLAAVIAADPPRPRQAGALGPLIAALLVKDPERRPGAEEVGAVLEAVAEGRPVPELAAGTSVTEAQEGLRLGEFGDDVGTVRLGTAPAAPDSADPDAVRKSEPEPGPEPQPSAEPVTTGVPHPAPGRPAPRRAVLRRRAALAAAAVLLVGGTWFAASYFGDTEDSAVAGQTATLAEAPGRVESARPVVGAWTEHSEKAMDAVLSLPQGYTRTQGRGDAQDQPRAALYTGGPFEVQFTEWDKAPATPMARARQSAEALAERGAGGSQYTATRFHGYEAVLADTTYGPDDTRSRAMALFIRTDDDRMYELRVDMPKGTPDEKQGTALFKGARERLVIGKR